MKSIIMRLAAKQYPAMKRHHRKKDLGHHQGAGDDDEDEEQVQLKAYIPTDPDLLHPPTFCDVDQDLSWRPD